MNVLALDLATTTGWARRREGVLESGYETFERKSTEGLGHQLLQFSSWLRWAMQRADAVVYEERMVHAAGGMSAIRILMGLAAMVEYTVARGAMPIGTARVDVRLLRPVPAATLKKWTTGKGNAKKPEMLAKVRERWRQVDDHNEADAIALLHYAEAVLIPGLPAGTGALRK